MRDAWNEEPDDSLYQSVIDWIAVHPFRVKLAGMVLAAAALALLLVMSKNWN